MKLSTALQRTAQRERKYPVLVALDLIFDWLLRAALVVAAFAVLGWILWQISPSLGARIAAGAMQIFR